MNLQTVENKGESGQFLEILENLEIVEILDSRVSSSEETPFVMTPLSGPEAGRSQSWVETFRGATEAFPDLPLWHRPPPNEPPQT